MSHRRPWQRARGAAHKVGTVPERGRIFITRSREGPQGSLRRSREIRLNRSRALSHVLPTRHRRIRHLKLVPRQSRAINLSLSRARNRALHRSLAINHNLNRVRNHVPRRSRAISHVRRLKPVQRRRPARILDLLLRSSIMTRGRPTRTRSLTANEI
jgi:hypothetical protein